MAYIQFLFVIVLFAIFPLQTSTEDIKMSVNVEKREDGELDMFCHIGESFGRLIQQKEKFRLESVIDASFQSIKTEGFVTDENGDKSFICSSEKEKSMSEDIHDLISLIIEEKKDSRALMAVKEKQNKELNSSLAVKEGQIKELNASTVARTEEIIDLRASLAVKEGQIKELNTSTVVRTEEIQDLRASLAAKEEEMLELRSSLAKEKASREEEIQDLRASLAAKEKKILELGREMNDLKDCLRSASGHNLVCGGHLQATTQVKHLYSHSCFGYHNYENRADCDWVIEASPGFSVHLTFLTFEIEGEGDCAYDYVEVYSGLDTSGASYGRFCGNSNPTDIVSMTEALLVRFRSDDSIVRKGFSAAYVAMEQ